METHDSSDSGGEELEVEVSVAFVAILTRKDLALLGNSHGSGESTLGEGSQEPAGRSRSATDCAASSMEELWNNAFLLTGCSHCFLAFKDAPLGGEDSRVFVRVRVSDHCGLHA